MIRLAGSYVAVPSHVTAFAAAPSTHWFAQVVIVHPVAIQFVPVFARSQRFSHVIPPGSLAGAHPTTALIANAVLLPILESHGLEIETLNVTLVPLAASVGVTGIRKVSVPDGTVIAVVFVHVTPVPTCAPHDHPLSENEEVGPVIFVGIVRTTVCTPLEARLPAFVIVIGICERRLVVSGHSGCQIPGIRSGTFADTYGSNLHSVLPLYVIFAPVPKFQFTPNPRSAGVIWTVFAKSVPQVIRPATVAYGPTSYAVHAAHER